MECYVLKQLNIRCASITSLPLHMCNLEQSSLIFSFMQPHILIIHEDCFAGGCHSSLSGDWSVGIPIIQQFCKSFRGHTKQDPHHRTLQIMILPQYQPDRFNTSWWVTCMMTWCHTNRNKWLCYSHSDSGNNRHSCRDRIKCGNSFYSPHLSTGFTKTRSFLQIKNLCIYTS